MLSVISIQVSVVLFKFHPEQFIQLLILTFGKVDGGITRNAFSRKAGLSSDIIGYHFFLGADVFC